MILVVVTSYFLYERDSGKVSYHEKKHLLRPLNNEEFLRKLTLIKSGERREDDESNNYHLGLAR